MNILLTGASGYIGSHLLLHLLEEGHYVYALARNPKHISVPRKFSHQVIVLQGDLLDPNSLPPLQELDAAYYLVHSMADNSKNFYELEEKSCLNFLSHIENTGIKQIIYLSGLHGGTELSKHFRSRLHVEEILKSSSFNITVVRASIIIGKKSAPFKIVCDLVDRLPFMVAPRWINTQCQPIALFDALYYLVHLLNEPKAMNRTFEIGGPAKMTFKEMLLTYARIKGLKRWILTVPVLTPHLSSYWLYLVTRVNFSLASTLVESLKVESIVKNPEIDLLLPHNCIDYEKAVQKVIAR